MEAGVAQYEQGNRIQAKETLEKAKAYIGQGFKALKLKGGCNVEEDVEKILRIRELVGAGIDLRFEGFGDFFPGQSAPTDPKAFSLLVDGFHTGGQPSYTGNGFDLTFTDLQLNG